MDVGLDSPVNVQQPQSLTFSPPSTPLTIGSPPASDRAASDLPPPSSPPITAPESADMSGTTPIQPRSPSPADPAITTSPTRADVLALRNELADAREHLARVQAQLQQYRDQNPAPVQELPTQSTTQDAESAVNDATDHSPESSARTGAPVPQNDTEDSAADPQNVPSTDARTQSEDSAATWVADEEVAPAATPATAQADTADPAVETSAAEPQPIAGSAPTADDSAEPSNPAAPAETPIPTPPATAESEFPDWLDIEEDTSAPGEEELKEIESSNEVSARDVKHHEDSFYVDAPEDPEQQPLHKMRLTWVIKGVRGTKEKPNRARIMNSPTVYVGGYYWYLKFFPRGNNSSALSAYVKCSRKERKPDEEVPENTFSAVYGDADADLGQLEPAVDMSIPASGLAPKKESKVEDEDATTEETSKKASETAAAPHDGSANASDDPVGRPVGADEEEGDGEDWRVSAQIGIILYNPDEPRTKFDMAACHQFNKHNDDWGWTNFHGPWSEVHQRRPGQRQALLRNDTLALDAYVRIFNDPSQALWWHHCGTEEQWDSVSLTGYPAFGARTYHNPGVAGITSWLLLAPFRNVFENLPAQFEHEDSLCSQLQMILFLMRKQRREEKYVSLNPLIEMIDRIGESGTDVVTFWEGFRRSLELELELQSAPNALEQLADIFDGSPAPDAGPVRASPLKIPVQGVSSVQLGLDQVLSQEASKQRFPKFLTVALERQKFDTAIREWKLAYDRVRLSEELDLSSWSTEPDTSRYTLYGFVVHVDERSSGEFYSILRPNGPGTKWLAFEDGTPDQVISYTGHRILEFEGLEGDALAENKACRQTAYLVMYIRTDLLDEFLPGKLEPFELAPWLRECDQVRDFLDPADKRSYEPVARSDVRLAIYSSDRAKDRRGLVDIKDLKSQQPLDSAEDVKHLTVPTGTTFQELRHKLAKWKGIDNVEKIKMWTMEPSSPGRCLSSAFKCISTLSKPVQGNDFVDRPSCIWMHVLASADEVRIFGDPEPAAADDAFEVHDVETEQENATSGTDAAGEDDAPSAEGAEDDVALPPEASPDAPTPDHAEAVRAASPHSPNPDGLATEPPDPSAVTDTVGTSADSSPGSTEAVASQVHQETTASTDQPAHPSSDAQGESGSSGSSTLPATGAEADWDVSAEDESLIASLIAQDVERLEEAAEARPQPDASVQPSSAETRDDPTEQAATDNVGGDETNAAEAEPDNAEAEPQNTEAEPHNAEAEPHNTEAEPENTEAQPQNTEAEPENAEAQPENAEAEPENAEAEAENGEAADNTETPPPPAPAEVSNDGGNEDDDIDDEDEEDDDVDDDAHSDSSDEDGGSKRRPMPFYYGFIQLFDAQKQDFVIQGDFLVEIADNVKETVRKRLGYAEDKQFLVWQRGNAYRLTSVQSSSSFADIRDESSRYDGFILVVGDVLSDSTKSSLTAISSFRSPEPLSHYLWFSARKHPVKAHTGDTTISAFGLDYYAGRLLKGLYSGHGTHITPTGHSYTGPFLAGSRSTTTEEAKGSCHYSNGDAYTGGWSNDEKDGWGEFVEKRTGNRYVGGYQNGKRWGKGTTYWEVADEEGEMCQICYSEGEDALFYDCGHVCACVECAKQVDVCPICRKTVQQVVKIWKA